MPESSYLALLLVGLLGGTHCVTMCGGIVGAFSMTGPTRWTLHLAYNAGRVVSYAGAGALAGALDSEGSDKGTADGPRSPVRAGPSPAASSRSGRRAIDSDAA